jgi:outer membrane biosynthesis protein TonB
MNITLEFKIDGTEAEVYAGINSYGVAIQHMKPAIAGKNKATVKSSKIKDEELKEGDVVIAVPKSEPEPEVKKEPEAEPKKEEPEAEPKKEEPEAEPKKEEPKSIPTVSTSGADEDIPLEKIQMAGASLMATHQAEMNALVAKYNISSLPELPQEQKGAFVAELRAMGADI